MQKPYEIIHAIEYIYDFQYQKNLQHELVKLYEGTSFNWRDLPNARDIYVTGLATDWVKEDFAYFINKFEALNYKLNIHHYTLIRVTLHTVAKQAEIKGYGKLIPNWWNHIQEQI